MANVQISNLNKRYETFEAVRGVSIDVEDGEFLILVGPSGCGKSTLLRVIAGLEEITSGVIKIGDKIVNHVPPKDRGIAMVFQNYALYPHMSVAQNMGFSLRLAGVAKPEVAAKVKETADVIGLTSLLDRYPRHLSGGQRQRVAMGRAIVRDPAVFLFDEPLSNLDAKLRVQMRIKIKELHQRLGTTVVYVTHDQVEAMTMADRIVVMNGGVVEQIGKPLSLYDCPENTFVASFIGSPSMNLIEGTIENGGNGAVFRSKRGMILSDLSTVHDDQFGKPIVFGIRPEHVELASSDDPNAVEAKVCVVEATGSETQVALQIGEEDFFAVFKERVFADPGTPIFLKILPERMHIFDQSSGRRLGA